jgi:uncharacterized oligopeptide transporter (OPT) family protein
MMAAEAHMQERQLTARGLLIGLGGLIVITASSMYVALRMGALPWPTVFVTVISMAALKKCKNSTIHEINCTHTVMSAGAMVAGGLAFTLPGLWMLDPSASIPTFTLIALTIVGTILGTAFTCRIPQTDDRTGTAPLSDGTGGVQHPDGRYGRRKERQDAVRIHGRLRPVHRHP